MYPFASPMMMGQAGSAAFAQTLWNPSDRSGGITLYDGGRTATLRASTYAGVRGITARSSGKYYFKGYFSSIGNATSGIGVANSAAPLSGYLGQTADSVSYFADGRIFTNNATAASAAAYNPGDVLGVAHDASAGKVWFARNGVWQNGNPAAGTGGVPWSGPAAYPALVMFGDSDFTLATDATGAPSGFLSWG